MKIKQQWMIMLVSISIIITSFANCVTGATLAQNYVGSLVTENFTGNAWVKFMTFSQEYNCPPMGLVTFEPSARNYWHSHAGGQILVVTEGIGYYQEEGKPARLLREGDVVEIPANIKHWHGAARDSWFKHIAVAANTELGGTEWFSEITDKEYHNLIVENPDYLGVSPIGQDAGFTGQAWAEMMQFDDSFNCPALAYVTFEPSARNSWHSHSGGQILIATSGEGYYQAEGEPAQFLREGDIVEIAPGVTHWHGAAPDNRFVHIAVVTNIITNTETVGGWFDPVTDEEYRAATSNK